LANNLKFKVASFSAVRTDQLLQHGLQPNQNQVHIFYWCDKASV